MDFTTAISDLGLLNTLLPVLAGYPYLFLFIGLLIGGETILLPVLYAAMSGLFSVPAVIAIMIVATIISDFFWYILGRGAVPSIVHRIFGQKTKKQFGRLESIIHGRELHILVISKFVYGTRIAAQVLCGARKVPLWHYFLANILAVILLSLVYIGIVYVAATFSYSIENLYVRTGSVITIVVAILITFHFAFLPLIKRK